MIDNKQMPPDDGLGVPRGIRSALLPGILMWLLVFAALDKLVIPGVAWALGLFGGN